jgi:hypothetical protein
MLDNEIFSISAIREIHHQSSGVESVAQQSKQIIPVYGVVYPSEFRGVGEFNTWAVRGFTTDTSRAEQLGESDIFGTPWEHIDMYFMKPTELERMGKFTVDAVAGHLEGHELPNDFFSERVARVCKGLRRADPSFLKRITL